MRELERDIGRSFSADQPVEHPLVLVGDGLGARFVAYRLSEERRVGMEARVVQGAQDGHALVERLAGHEAPGAELHAVSLHEALQPGAVRRLEDGRAR